MYFRAATELRTLLVWGGCGIVRIVIKVYMTKTGDGKSSRSSCKDLTKTIFMKSKSNEELMQEAKHVKSGDD